MCGIAGVWNVENAYNVLHDLLLSLQHRGQQSAGVVLNGFKAVKGLGLVESVLTEERFIPGSSGIGHVRYSTFGSIHEIQPLVAHTSKGTISIAHNGNLVDAEARRKFVQEKGGIFSTTLDSELFIHYFSLAPYNDPITSVQWSLSKLKLAYSTVYLHEKFLIAARDSYGIRPLFFGKYQDGYIVASEDCALNHLGAEDITEVEPGTIVVFSENKPQIIPFEAPKKHFCSFEFVYFARPDSNFSGINVHILREALGEELYEEHKIQADIVVPVLDSGFSGALGYSKRSKIPLELGLIRNHYIGRSFIMPSKRTKIVKNKLAANTSIVKDKNIVLVDDSIVRGTTMKIIVEMLKDAGAKEITVAIFSPPVIGPCNYGIDTSRRNELIASNFDIEEVRKLISSDKLIYLSSKRFKNVFRKFDVGVCTGCFDLNYPA